jgi:hypothetical protein
MKLSFIKLACLLALTGFINACTVFGIETESTTTEIKNSPGLQGRIERLESRLERLESRLENHTKGGR